MTTTQLRHRTTVLAMAAAALTLTACGSSQEPAANTATATSATASTSTPAAPVASPSESNQSTPTAKHPAGTPRGTSAPATDSATSRTATMLPTTAGDYGDGLLSAWRSGNSSAMAQYATSAVVAKLSATKAPASLLRTTCEEGTCSWANESGQRVTVTMNEQKVLAGHTQAVTSVKVAN